MSGFKNFLLRGNVVDLAVAVVVGGAFTVIVNSFVADLLTPLIAAFGGLPDFGNLYVQIGQSKITYGNFINALVSFLLVAAVIYFLVIRPYDKLASRFTPPPSEDKRDCPECMSSVPTAARRCAYCTSELAPV